MDSRPPLRPRRAVTAGLLALVGAAGCRRKPTTHRVAKLAHDPCVLWPTGESPAGGWPVLLFLHGQGEAAWVVDGSRETEQSSDAVLRHEAPPALHRARDPRVKTLWQNFVVFAPQAVNDEGLARYWRWGDTSVRHRLMSELSALLANAKVDATRLYGAGFSRGGLGCVQLDASTGPLQLRKLVTADAQSLEELPAVAERRRDVRLYYARSSFEEIVARHVAAEKELGPVSPTLRFIPMDVPGKDGDAHIALCSRVFTQDEVYRWLLA